MGFLCGYPTPASIAERSPAGWSRGVPGWEAGEAASPDFPTYSVNGRIGTADETLT